MTDNNEGYSRKLLWTRIPSLIVFMGYGNLEQKGSTKCSKMFYIFDDRLREHESIKPRAINGHAHGRRVNWLLATYMHIQSIDFAENPSN